MRKQKKPQSGLTDAHTKKNLELKFHNTDLHEPFMHEPFMQIGDV